MPVTLVYIVLLLFSFVHRCQILMYIFYTATHVWHAYGISKYINRSTEQQRVNLTSKMAEADTQDARLSCIFNQLSVLTPCFAHQFDDTH